MSKLNWKAALTVCGLCLTAQHNPAWGQTRPDNVSKEVELEEIVVSSTRIGNKGSLSNSKVDGSELQETNMGENLPYLLQRTPSLVVTSDDGLGIGYVYFRVRGTDQSRINMTINGVPLNDSESQSVFWVNMTDMVGSMGSLDVQRGVGTSTNGAAAFGASVNMQTEKPSARPYAEVSFNGGSYNTFRESVKAGTGIMKGGFAIDARYSKVNSDGYIDHASSDLYSYYASAAWYGQQTMVKLLAFGGAERTGIGWDGISPDTWRDNPRYNGAGEYTDADGSTQYYENNTDNYRQQHFQAHVSHMFDRRWSLNAALHYTNGYGYSEQVKTDEAFADYGMALPSSGITEGNLIRRKYLDNDFYGATFAANYRADRLQLTLGGAANNYEGAHFGEIINVVGMDYDGPLGDEYYRNQADKLDANVYAKANWEIVKGLSVYGDLQYRFIRYRLDGINDEDFESKTPSMSGMIVRDYTDSPSNFRYTKTLSEAMEDFGIPGISGVDTRQIARIIRDEGSQRVLITDADMPLEECLAKLQAWEYPRDVVRQVSCKRRRSAVLTKFSNLFQKDLVICQSVLALCRNISQAPCIQGFRIFLHIISVI